MERLSVSVNKGNLLRLQQDLDFARGGLEILDEKKEALLGHISTLSSKAEKVRERVHGELETIYRYLREAVLIQGRLACEKAAMGTSLNEELTTTEKSYMGVPLPHAKIKLPKLTPSFGFHGTGAAMDSVIKSVHECLGALMELAEIEVGLFRLIAEVKKTIKRLNALENIYIPLYRSTVKYLADNLEEKEREFLFQLKRQKELREAEHEPV